MATGNLAPTQPVNKGLAFDIKPIYPEVISMMESAKAQKLESDKFEYKKQQDGLNFIQESKVDTQDLNPAQTEYVGLLWKGIENSSIQSMAKGVNIQADLGIRGSVTDLTTQAERFRASNQELKDITTRLDKGDLGHYDPALLGAALQEEQQKSMANVMAKNKGEEYEGSLDPDYQAVLERQDLKNHSNIAADAFEKYETKRKSFVTAAKVGDGDFAMSLDMPDADMFVRDAKGEIVLDDNYQPVMLDVAPKEFVRYQMETDPEYMKSVDYRISISPEGTTRGDIIARDFRENAQGVTVGSMSRIPVDRGGEPTDTEAKQALRLEYVQRGSDVAKSGNTQQINNWLAGVSQNINGVNYNYTPDGEQIVAEYTKPFFEAEGIDITSGNVEDFFGAGAKLLKNGSVVKEMPFGKANYAESLMDILNTSKHIKPEDRIGALNIVEGTTGGGATGGGATGGGTIGVGGLN